MKSGKQRRAELKAKRIAKRAIPMKSVIARPKDAVPVNVEALAAYNSYSVADFVARGFYIDLPFVCQACGRQQLWTAHQQKWWYEVAKGSRWTTARLCRSCRRQERTRKDWARKIHFEGLARKQQSKMPKP